MLPRLPKIARMAESVDALVSNTSGRKAVPVRPRLRVLIAKRKALIHKEMQGFLLLLLKLYYNNSIFIYPKDPGAFQFILI